MKTNVSKISKKITSGFSIAELLVVIAVIGILAIVVVVSYQEVLDKTDEVSLTADLVNATDKLKLYYSEYRTYPLTVSYDGKDTYCPQTPVANNYYCYKSSNGNLLTYTYKTRSTFEIHGTKDTKDYIATEGAAPVAVGSTPSEPSSSITAIAAITGTAQVGQTLTAGAITPAGATVTYQWQSATTASGTYDNIAGATNNAYVVSLVNVGKYIKVAVTGTGSYTGTQTSVATAQVPVDNTNWLTIGSQAWAKANLNVGTMITGLTSQTDNATIEKYCYNNTESNCTTYGGLYQWNEAMKYTNTEGTQGICPAGTHIPSDNDWKILEVQLGMTQAQADLGSAWRGTDQGTQLKSGGSSGLNMPLAGYRSTDGSFYNLSSNALLWSSSESGGNAWYRNLLTSQADVYRSTIVKAGGFSVRCLGN